MKRIPSFVRSAESKSKPNICQQRALLISRPLRQAFYPMQPKRKSQRKQDYDYSQPGYHAVTVCTQNRSCLFGVIGKGDMLLNEAGRMIDKIWHEMPEHHPGIALDVMQIMPNHLHGIIVVREVGTDPWGVSRVRPLEYVFSKQFRICWLSLSYD